MQLPMSGHRASPNSIRARCLSVLRLLWMVLLVLPAASFASATQAWDIDSHLLFALSCWLILALRLTLPQRLFFLSSLPIALLGVICIGADFLRNANLLDLGLQWQTFSSDELHTALGPYVFPVVLIGLVLMGWCWACMAAATQRRASRVPLAAVLAVTLVLASALPHVVWVRAWPLNGVLVAASAATQSRTLLAALQPALSSVDPRDRAATWKGRATSAASHQTMVFIVGESVRADFLQECHGPPKVRPAAADAVVACDVTSGSDATHTSVPLLISRDMPGRPYRVSTDATFQRALQEAGFETHWIGDQGRSLAWPDAQWQDYPEYAVSDEATIGPLFTKALARPAPRKAIVLHAYNAHEPYCKRFDPGAAPYPVDCRMLVDATDAEHAKALRAAYANAVDASVRFVNGVIEELRHQQGEVFVLFTPDHGENLFDDARQLFGHALKHPTRWDVHVPAIFWANDAWRLAHQRQWANLRAQASAPLMHADMVPTMLSAAGVAYEDARTGVANLLDDRAPRRQRTIQRGLGAVIDWDALVREARQP